MYSDIKNAIKTKLEAITGIEHVYGYEKGNLDGYPSAVVTLAELEITQDGTCQDMRRYSYKVSVYQEMDDSGAGAEEAEERIEALIDTVIGEFEDDYTLGGVASNINLKADLGYSDRGVKMRVFELIIDVYALYNLT